MTQIDIDAIKRAIASVKPVHPRSAEEKATDVFFEDGDYFEVRTAEGDLVVMGVWPEGQRGIQ